MQHNNQHSVSTNDFSYEIAIASVCGSAMVFVPVIIWLCLFCSDKRRRQDEASSDEVAIRELENSLKDEIARFQLLHINCAETYPSVQNEMLKVNQEWNNRITLVRSNAEKRKGRSEPVSFCRIYSGSFYVVSWISAIFLIIYVPVVILTDSSLSLSLLIVSAAGLGIGVLFVCFESICARERRHLKNLDSTFAVLQQLVTLRATPPNISLYALAYHYVTRYRTVTSTDAQGNAQSNTESYRERVVTGRFAEVFQFEHWKDESQPEIEDISANQVTQIKMELVVGFADTDTETLFNEQYEVFKTTYKNADVHVDFSESRTVEGFKSRLAAYTDLNKKKWWIRERYYCISTLLGCTWPYRLMFNRATGKTSYTLNKSVQRYLA